MSLESERWREEEEKNLQPSQVQRDIYKHGQEIGTFEPSLILSPLVSDF